MDIVSSDEFEYADDANTGWCVSCKEFTTDCVEPDAVGYACEECGQSTVYGAQEAVLQGLLTITDED